MVLRGDLGWVDTMEQLANLAETKLPAGYRVSDPISLTREVFASDAADRGVWLYEATFAVAEV